MTRKELLFILIITFAVVMVWVIANIKHAQSKVEVSPELQKVSQDIEPSFSKWQDTLDQISKIP